MCARNYSKWHPEVLARSCNYSKWQRSVWLKSLYVVSHPILENPWCDRLYRHSSQCVCFWETLPVSPRCCGGGCSLVVATRLGLAPWVTYVVRVGHACTTIVQYSPEKWLHNRIYCPSDRSKQIQESHTAYSAGVRTLAVPHNWETPFHRHQRSKAWPWQKALVHTVLFNTEFYGC